MNKQKKICKTKLKIIEIPVNKDNYRFEDLKHGKIIFKNESETIKYFCCDKKGNNMLKLVESICKHGYFPNKSLIVIQ
ncbi:MAG: hypothetical protein Q8899_01855 [Weeping tea tree witches'-broom phytoplasma]|uniref:hypothetical protein n=1 Tax=Candidatus Phytoplasma melaleucae TaxID=2982630 RepID=UPI00293B21CF|nr:hypothetical protein [Weeping tea tree witches'-broom phytoplasma]